VIRVGFIVLLIRVKVKKAIEFLGTFFVLSMEPDTKLFTTTRP
jgi:hypothetical protein